MSKERLKSSFIYDWKRQGLKWETQEEIDEIYERYDSNDFGIRSDGFVRSYCN